MPTNKNNANIVSLNGNVKNGLIYYSTSPSTGELHDKNVMRCGGKKRCGGKRKKAPWGTDAEGNQVWITDDGRILNPGDDFEVMIPSDFPDRPQSNNDYRFMYPNSEATDYLTRTRKSNNTTTAKKTNTNNAVSKYKFNNGNNNVYLNFPPSVVPVTTTPPSRSVQQRAIEQGRAALRGNALENNRPQYHAERDLPLFEDGAAIQSGLVRAGWSHGRGTGNNLVDIPTMNVDLNNYSFGSAPRRGSGQAASPAPDKRPAPAVPTRTTPSFAVDANLDPGKIPTSVAQAAHQQAADANGRQYGVYDGVTPRDWMSLAGNVAGSIGSWLASRNAPKVSIAEPLRPFIETPVRLKTRYNNRPQIAAVRENTRRAYNDIRQNTASSSAALSRMQRARNAAVQNINELEANRENIETQLINADRMNRQQVRTRNAAAMNKYYQDVASARTRQSIADAQRKSANQAALSNLFNNVNLSFQDFLGRMDRREAFNNTLAYLRAANPDYDDRMFKDNGAKFADMYLQALNKKV